METDRIRIYRYTVTMDNCVPVTGTLHAWSNSGADIEAMARFFSANPTVKNGDDSLKISTQFEGYEYHKKF